MSDPWMQALSQFYGDLDRDVAERGVACKACGHCCHFDVMDHVVFASSLERRYLRQTAPPVPADRQRDPMVASGGRCPYQVDSGCTARDGRVLGCRLYHCAWTDPRMEEEVYAMWHNRLKRLHDRLGEPWEYERLLPLDPL